MTIKTPVLSNEPNYFRPEGEFLLPNKVRLILRPFLNPAVTIGRENNFHDLNYLPEVLDLGEVVMKITEAVLSHVTKYTLGGDRYEYEILVSGNVVMKEKKQDISSKDFDE